VSHSVGDVHKHFEWADLIIILCPHRVFTIYHHYHRKLYLDGVQCERAHCMGQLTKAYHHQQQNLLALMSSYQQLNAAEKCGDIYEVAIIV